MYYGVQKEAFSDGVSSVEKSWYEIIQDSLSDSMDYNKHSELTGKCHMIPRTREQKYYQRIYHERFNESRIKFE